MVLMKTTRRGLLFGTCAAGAVLPQLQAASRASFPSELRRFADPATEFPIFRLTNPAHSSWLPSAASRFISRKSHFLLYTCDRGGKSGLYRLDLKNGESGEIAQGEQIDIRFAALSADDHNCCYADGETLWMSPVQGLGARPREVYRSPENWRRLSLTPAITEDGIAALWPERGEKSHRIRVVSLTRTSSTATIAESPEPIGEVLPRPRRAGAMYRRGQELWLVSYDGQQNYKLRIAPRPFSSAQWTADGRSLLYLSHPEPPGLIEIREFTPDTNEDKLVAKTSQFASFARNADASVFVGASGSKASPYVMLLVRAAKRELTVAEHKSSEASAAMPVFSPNSQRIFFESDREGKHCIYAMTVDKLVEETTEQ
jgi:oligogalacturonide lyase